MHTPESAEQLLAILSQYDERRASDDYDPEDVRNIHDYSTLTRDLTRDGVTAVLSVPKALHLASSKPDPSEVARIRRGLIEHFLSKQALQKLGQVQKAITSSDLTFRARMKAEAALIQMAAQPEPTKFELAKSGVALFIYGLVGFTVWAWMAPVLYEFLLGNYHIKEWLARSLFIGSTIIVYGLLMTVLWRRVKTSLELLIEPKLDATNSKPIIVARYIASALVAGLTIMLVVLIINYIAHSAASAAEDARIEKVAALVAEHSHLWGVMTAIPKGSNIEPSLGADFGSFAGTFGDFFGGVINPILTFGTLIALTITLVMQRAQLVDEKQRASEAANVSNLQTFETTFFNLLNLHANTISGLHFTSDHIKLPSQLFSEIINRPNEEPAADSVASTGRPVFTEVLETIHAVPGHRDIGMFVNKDYATPAGIYRVIQERHNYALGHYFRNLYQVLAFVDRYTVRLKSGGVDQDYKARKRYTNILRAQLSAHELCLLFYNCDGQLVDHGAFRHLLIEWELLEHIPLRYSFHGHYLHIEGYANYPVDHMIEQYLGDLNVGQRKGGAFGKNPQVALFLELRQFLKPHAPGSQASAAE